MNTNIKRIGLTAVLGLLLFSVSSAVFAADIAHRPGRGHFPPPPPVYQQHHRHGCYVPPPCREHHHYRPVIRPVPPVVIQPAAGFYIRGKHASFGFVL